MVVWSIIWEIYLANVIPSNNNQPSNSAVFIFSSTMGAIYEEHKDEDGFLYIAYSGENTFGMWSATSYKYELIFTWLSVNLNLLFWGDFRLAMECNFWFQEQM